MRQVILFPDLEDGGYTVEVPACPAASVKATRYEEGLENIKDAIQGYIESLEADGLPVPPEESIRVLLTAV